MTEGRRRFLLVPVPLNVWRLLREEPLRGLHELDRVLDLRAKLRGRQQLAVSDEGKRHGFTSEVIGE